MSNPQREQDRPRPCQPTSPTAYQLRCNNGSCQLVLHVNIAQYGMKCPLCGSPMSCRLAR